jgi:hypothetical protein
MGCVHAGIDRAGAEMIRRKWFIYERKSRQIVSVLYHQRKHALHDLHQLNDYCGKKKYAMQLTRTDTGTGRVVSMYPDIELKELSKTSQQEFKTSSLEVITNE